MSIPPILQRLRLPVVGAPLFIVSNPDLVIAQCKAGIVGSFPALNARPAPVLEEWLARITGELADYDARHPEAPAAPFAVNQIVHRTNPRLLRDLELCVKYRVPIMITSLGAREEVNQAAHSYGGITLHDVINVTHAHKAVEKGADGLIAVAAGAGGHAGKISPFALVQEIRAWFDGPLALSGAIATGGAVLAAQAMGADLAYVGSAFIATEEARAQPEYKQMIVDSGADDIVYTDFFSGVYGSYLKPSVRRGGYDPDALPAGEGMKIDLAHESKAWRDIWSAGQGIGAIREVVPAAELVARLATEYRAAKARLAGSVA
jgi:nitronate monooxygenase